MNDVCCFIECLAENVGTLRECKSDCCKCNPHKLKFHHICIIAFNDTFNFDEQDENCPSSGIEDNLDTREHQTNFNEILRQNLDTINQVGRKKSQPAWGFFRVHPENAQWYYCIKCYLNPPTLTSSKDGLIKYNKNNTATIRNHCFFKHKLAFDEFSKYLSNKRKVISEEPASENSQMKVHRHGAGSDASSVSSNILMNRFLNSDKPYSRDAPIQLKYEASPCKVTVDALTPLSMCENKSYREHIALLDPRIMPVSRTRLTRKLLPNLHADVKSKLKSELSNAHGVSIQLDLWMTKKTEEIFSLNGTYKHGASYKCAHLGMPFSSSGTDGQNLSIAVKNCIEEFDLSHKIIAYTKDGGSNLATCVRALDDVVDNSSIFHPKQPLFDQPCLAHALQGACKAAVINVQSDDESVSVEKTRKVMQSCITWTKKNHKGMKFLTDSQLHCNISPRKLVTPVSTRFAYLIVAFRCLLQNRSAIDYLFGEKPGMSNELRKRKPSWQDWEVTKMVVSTLQEVVGSVVLNQTKNDKWLLSDAMDDLISVYLKACRGVDVVLPLISDQCKEILITQENSEESVAFVKNLEEISMKMCKAVRLKLRPFLNSLLDMTCQKQNAHMFFALLLDPRFLQLKKLLALHQQEDCNSIEYFAHMKKIFIEMVVAAEDKRNPYDHVETSGTTPYALPAEIFFNDEMNMDEQSTLARAKIEFTTYTKLVNKHFQSGKTMESPSEVIQWYELIQGTIPMIFHFAHIIFSITPSQIENERDFSLAGVVGRARRASFTAENLSMIVFINKNKEYLDTLQRLNIFKDNFDNLEGDLDEAEDYLETTTD